MMQSKPDTLDPVAGRQTLILGGQDFQSITEIVSGVLERPAPLGWWLVLGVALLALGGLGHRRALALLGGDRRLGHQRPGRLGLGHHELRLLDRHRPRRHADLGDPASSSARSGAPRSTAPPRR